MTVLHFRSIAKVLQLGWGCVHLLPRDVAMLGHDERVGPD